MDHDDFINAFRGMNLNAEELYQQHFGDYTKQGPFNNRRYNQYDPFQAFQEKLKPRAHVPFSPPYPPPAAAGDPKARRQQIDAELDILRGVVPTPKGYIVNPLRAKALMAELKALPV